MAELIDKRVLLESLEQTEKELENAMTCPSWWNALRIIEEQQVVAKEDIRAAAIDEFVEKVRQEYENAISIPQIEIDFANKVIDRVAEQLKESKVYE